MLSGVRISTIFRAFLASVTLAGFCAPMSARADSLRLLPTGETSLAARLLQIRSATRSIDLMTYELDPCSASSKLILGELKAKARAGVKVRVIADAFPGDRAVRADLTADLARYGIQMAYYNLQGLNHRLHAKLMVVDGARYITGGRNMTDEYFGLSSKYNYVDSDVAVEGPSSRDAARGFETVWRSPKAGREGPTTAESFARYQQSCLAPNRRDRALAKHLLGNDLARAQALVAAQPEIACAQTGFTLDRPDFDTGEGFSRKQTTHAVVGALLGLAERVKAELASLDRRIASAPSARVQAALQRRREAVARRHSVLLANWAYLPKLGTAEAFNALREAGVPIEVFTNRDHEVDHVAHVMPGYVSHDNTGSEQIHTMASDGSMNDRWSLTPRGARWHIHSKAMVLDGGSPASTAIVSSFNLDDRSYMINLEESVVVRSCPAFSNELSKSIRRIRGFVANDRHRCPECERRNSPQFFNPFSAIADSLGLL